MALLWMDGFDHYGTQQSDLTDYGAWAERVLLGGTFAVGRTGSNALSGGSSAGFGRRVLGGPKATVVIGYAMHITNLPVYNGRTMIQFSNAANISQFSLLLDSTGTLTAGGLTTTSPVIVTSAWNYIEMRVDFDSVNGAFEVRVDGVTVLNGVDVNTGTECSQVALYPAPHNGSGRIDDLYCCDGTGTTNNDFLGDRRVRTIYPDADTATAEWSVTGALNGFAAINQTSPDGDASYIEAGVATPVTSEFGLQDLPASTGAIAGIQTYIMQRKTEAGDGSTQTSLVSGASVADGADRPITEVYTYWMDVFELDPDTGAAWTKAGVDAAKLRLKRTL